MRAPKRRIVTHGPSIASGGITAWSREPSAEPGVDHRATTGRAAGRAAPRPVRRAARSRPRRAPARRRPASPRRSTKARPGPLIITSVTSGSPRSGSRGPSPATSSTSSPTRRSRRVAGRSGCSSRKQVGRGAPAARASTGTGSSTCSSTSRRWTARFSVGSSSTATVVGAGERDDGHAAAPRAGAMPVRAVTSIAARPSTSGRRLGEHTGVDRTRHGVAQRDPGDHRRAEHVGDLASRERATRARRRARPRPVLGSTGDRTARRSAR